MGAVGKLRFGAMALLLGMLAALAWAGPASAAFSGEITGRVTDEAGEPIAGLTVCARGSQPLIAMSGCDYQTDAEGRYAIEGLREEFYVVDFFVEGNPALNYVQQWWPGKGSAEEAEPVLVTEGMATENIDAQMQEGGRITGTVTDRETGEPIEGVDVCPQVDPEFEEGLADFCGVTDAAGEYVASSLGTGRYQVRFETFEGPNYVAETLPGTVAVTAGATTEGVDGTLLPGLEFEGDVTDATTGVAPVHGPPSYSTVTVCAFSTLTETRVGCVPTEPDGHYALGGLPPADYVIGFGVDLKEDGVDLHPDGYVRRFWDEVENYGEATPIGSPTGTVITGIDAALTPGEEVWPPEPPTGGEPAPEVKLPATPLAPPPLLGPPPPALKKPLVCHKGFQKVAKRCVKTSKKSAHRGHRRRHRHKAAPPR